MMRRRGIDEKEEIRSDWEERGVLVNTVIVKRKKGRSMERVHLVVLGGDDRDQDGTMKVWHLVSCGDGGSCPRTVAMVARLCN